MFASLEIRFLFVMFRFINKIFESNKILKRSSLILEYFYLDFGCGILFSMLPKHLVFFWCRHHYTHFQKFLTPFPNRFDFLLTFGKDLVSINVLIKLVFLFTRYITKICIKLETLSEEMLTLTHSILSKNVFDVK